MKAALPVIRSGDDRLLDRARPIQLVDNDGDDALQALAASIATGAPAKRMLGYEQIGPAALATVASLSPPEGATAAVVQNNGTAACRWRADGEEPGALEGMRLYGGGDTQTFVGNLDLVRIIRESDNVTLDVGYYG